MTRLEIWGKSRTIYARLVPTAFALLCSVVPTNAAYQTAPGDVVEVTLAGAPELRQRALIQQDGTISLPIIGTIRVAGLSSSEIQAKVEAVLATKMLRQRMSDGREHVIVIQPGDVAAAIAEYRPVYVNGDVLNPGQHTYRPSMTVRQAVALSGGYSILRRVLSSTRDPAELRGDYKSLWTQLAREKVRAWRLQAELEGKDEFEPRALGDVPVPESTFAEIVRSETESLKISQADVQQEKAFLLHAIKQADEQTIALTAQQEQEEQGLQADSEELGRAYKLFGAGSLPSPRVAEIRRAVLLSSTRKLQTTVELIQIKKQRDEFGRRLEKLANERRVNLLHDVNESSVKLAELGSKLEVVGLKLGLLGRARASKPSSESAGPEITVVRKSEEKWNRRPAEEDTELEPGDVIDVMVRSEDLADGLAAN